MPWGWPQKGLGGSSGASPNFCYRGAARWHDNPRTDLGGGGWYYFTEAGSRIVILSDYLEGRWGRA